MEADGFQTDDARCSIARVTKCPFARPSRQKVLISQYKAVFMNVVPKELWRPTPEQIEQSNLKAFLRWLEVARGLVFEDYQSLWAWSVNEPEAFWAALWDYFPIRCHSNYDSVWDAEKMPGTKWFAGSTLNYAEHIFKGAVPHQPAILFQSERSPLQEISWKTLENEVGALQAFLRQAGVEKGDRVVGFLPNIPQATTALLAATGMGCVWSSCSPDFGVDSVVERFAQIEPKVFIAVDGYAYGGKAFDKRAVVEAIVKAIPGLEVVIFIPYLDAHSTLNIEQPWHLWAKTIEKPAPPVFTPLPFDHPIWILYSSGTTGKPKAITHSQGGILMEHYKYLLFHNDVKPGERYFWFSTTGWMMWNFVQGALLAGATIVIYDGSPGYPDMGVMWRLIKEAGIHHFGTSAPYILACMKAGIHPKEIADLKHLRSISSTGSPLPPEGFKWIYDEVSEHIWLCSMSGGTDVCTAFVGGCPLLPVYEGEIQTRALGCALYAWDDGGESVEDALGEMVITRPMPSMPIYFWNDADGSKYHASYFEDFPGVWRHGDFIRITPRGGVVIYGRSDATLNRHGVRIGTAEIYRAVDTVSAIQDALIVNLERPDGQHFMPLFVVMKPGETLTPEIEAAIATALRTAYSPRHVPDQIIACEDIPYTISGKKLEAPVKKILMGIPIERAASKDALRNPESLDYFVAYAQKLKA